MRSPCKVVIVLPLLLFVLGGCAISRQQEIEMGRKMHPQFEQEFGGLVPDPQLQEYVQRVGMEVAKRTDRADLPWQFRVVQSDQVNAFALPGGYVYVTQGLLRQLENEAQLASILGHEAAHVAHRHSVKQIQRAQGWQGASAAAGILGGLFGYGGVGDAAGAVSTLALLSYGRDQEREADLSGLSYLARAGYAPQANVEAMQIIQQAGGGRGAPEFLSSHPNPGNRIEYLREEIEEDYQNVAASGRLGEDEFQQRVFGGSATAGRRRGTGEAAEAEPAGARDAPAAIIGRPAASDE